MRLEVIVCTHNPRIEFLTRALSALRAQTLPYDKWNLTIIDNLSQEPLANLLDLSWHPFACLIREPRLGLTYARLRGISEARGELLVWVDDDNLLDRNFLEEADRMFALHPRLGIAGGKSIPEYVEAPPNWYSPDLAPLGCCNHGEQQQFISAAKHPRSYPAKAPIGAGMVTRRIAIQIWADAIANDPQRQKLGRTGSALSSGEDNDINLTLLRNGWDLAYVPQLKLTHLIPPGRLTLDYQKRIARASFRDFVKVLDLHGIRPWPAIPRWSIPLRALKAWVALRAWTGPASHIQWEGMLGQYEGRAEIGTKAGSAEKLEVPSKIH